MSESQNNLGLVSLLERPVTSVKTWEVEPTKLRQNKRIKRNGEVSSFVF